MGAPVPKYSLHDELEQKFGDYMMRASSSDGRPRTILRLPRDRLGLSPDWQQQVQQAAQLRHPHVMQVHEMYLDDQFLNVVLDACSGGSLQQYLHGSRLTEERARWLFQQLVLAVDYLHSQGVAGLDLQNIMLHVPGNKAGQQMVCVCCPLIKLVSSLPSSSSSSSSSGLTVFWDAEHLADIAACGVVLLNMLGGRLQDCSWGYSRSADMVGTDSSSSSSGSAPALGTSALGEIPHALGTSASAGLPYFLPEDYRDRLSKECQQLLQRLLSPDPLRMVLSTTELLQDTWVQHNLSPAAAKLNEKCSSMKPLWKEAKQQLPEILAAAATTVLGFKVWQHLPDMLQSLEGNWQQQQRLDAALFGCSNGRIAVWSAPDSQQRRRLWACSLLLPGSVGAGSQVAEHAPGVQGPAAAAAAGQLPRTGLFHALQQDAQQRDQQLQEQQHQEQEQEQVHPQQSWPMVAQEDYLFTKVPSPEFMTALQQLFAGQQPAVGATSSSSDMRGSTAVVPVAGMCLKPPVLLLEPEHGTLAAWLVQQHQAQSGSALTLGWSVLQRLLLDVAAGLQALHSQTPPLVHGCINAGAVHLLQPLSGARPEATSSSTAEPGAQHPQVPSVLQPDQPEQQSQQLQVAQLSLLWPWRQAVCRTRSAHAWLSAPEVLQHAAAPTPASDIYGLGMLMLQLVTGWVPGVHGATSTGADPLSSDWSLDSPVPGAALAAAVTAAAQSTGDQQQLQWLCADLKAACGLSWSSSRAAAASVNTPAGFMELVWRCLSADPAARPSLAEVVVELHGMEIAVSKAHHEENVSRTVPQQAAQASIPAAGQQQQHGAATQDAPGSAAAAAPSWVAARQPESESPRTPTHLQPDSSHWQDSSTTIIQPGTSRQGGSSEGGLEAYADMSAAGPPKAEPGTANPAAGARVAASVAAAPDVVVDSPGAVRPAVALASPERLPAGRVQSTLAMIAACLDDDDTFVLPAVSPVPSAAQPCGPFASEWMARNRPLEEGVWGLLPATECEGPELSASLATSRMQLPTPPVWSFRSLQRAASDPEPQGGRVVLPWHSPPRPGWDRPLAGPWWSADVQLQADVLDSELDEEYDAWAHVLEGVAESSSVKTCSMGIDGDCQLLAMTRDTSGGVQPGIYCSTPVSVKLMAAGPDDTPDVLQNKLKHEAELHLRASSCAGVARLMAVCFDPPALVMEQCECSLADRIRNNWACTSQPQQLPMESYPEPSWPLVMRLMANAADTLSFLHRPGKAIFHNDLRAENFMLKLRDGVWALKLAGFGLAVVANAAAQVMVSSILNPCWCAPELYHTCDTATGRVAVSAQTDIYALAMRPTSTQVSMSLRALRSEHSSSLAAHSAAQLALPAC